MRVAGIIVRLIAVGLWLFWYLYISALACAFGSTSGNCAFPLPWQMNGEDLLVLVLVPGGLVALVFLLVGALDRRRAARNRDQNNAS